MREVSETLKKLIINHGVFIFKGRVTCDCCGHVIKEAVTTDYYSVKNMFEKKEIPIVFNTEIEVERSYNLEVDQEYWDAFHEIFKWLKEICNPNNPQSLQELKATFSGIHGLFPITSYGNRIVFKYDYLGLNEFIEKPTGELTER